VSVVLTLPADSPYIDALLEEELVGVVVTADECSVHAESKQVMEDVLSRAGAPATLLEEVKQVAEDEWRDLWQEELPRVLEFSKLRIALVGESGDLVLSPGRSFGVGHHPTTAMIIELLCKYSERLQGRTVLDFGCGSGVLGLAALKLGALKVYAIDIDEEARKCAAENAVRNGIEEDHFITGLPEEPVEILLVNVLLQTQLENAERLKGLSGRGSIVFSSGFLVGEEQQVAGILGLNLLEVVNLKQWSGIIGERI
jgi:ribosomal protein L11 methyltransferase